MKLSNYLLKRKVQSLAEQSSTRKHRFCNLDDARDILIVYDLQDKEQVEKCKRKLKSLNKKIHACMYIPTGTFTSTSKNKKEKKDILINDSSDTDLWKIPHKPVVDKFIDIPADILIDLTRKNNHVMHYLVLSHPSGMKVGRKNPSFSLYDLAIIEPEEKDVCRLFDNIVFYLQSIRSK